MYPSNIFYTKFAHQYSNYAKKRTAYISSVDNLIIRESKIGTSIIDVGAGDGIRSKYIASQLQACSLTMIDNSDGMLALCDNQDTTTIVIKADIADKKFFRPTKYDLVLCLWNVLGHLPSFDLRLQALKNMAALLDKEGRLFIDVNNRYNISQYGFIPVMRNIVKDIFRPHELNGNFDLYVTSDQEILSTTVHVFSPKEITALIKSAGLHIIDKISINYSNGKRSRNHFDGQLIYKLCKK